MHANNASFLFLLCLPTHCTRTLFRIILVTSSTYAVYRSNYPSSKVGIAFLGYSTSQTWLNTAIADFEALLGAEISWLIKVVYAGFELMQNWMLEVRHVVQE